VGEDLDLGRQYVPQSLCNKFGIQLNDRNCKQPNFNLLMEELFTRADDMYVSADIGIGMLPKEVREVIRVARVLYHQIHEEIRCKKYDIFNSGRIRVKFQQKVAIATKL
jgi:phytoene/squalene synthetase